MTQVRPARAADAPRLTGLLAQLGYPSELVAVTNRLAGILNSATQQILVAVPADDSRIDGYIGVERRLALVEDERVGLGRRAYSQHIENHIRAGNTSPP